MNRSSYGSEKMGRIRGVRMLQRRGYVASVVGTVGGGIGLSGLGAYLGSAYARRYMPNAGLEALLPFLVGLWGGYWIGTVSGAWAALRFCSYRARLATAALVGLLAPLMYPALAAVHSVIPTDRTQLPSRIAAVLVLAGIGAAARAIALRFSPSGERSEKPPRAER
jgi:hypothetical protein